MLEKLLFTDCSKDAFGTSCKREGDGHHAWKGARWSAADSSIRRCNVQVDSIASRSVGNGCYRIKNYADCTCRIADVFKSEGLKTRKQRPSHLTPPYVTAEPAVTHRPLVSPNGDKLRFVILATDGRE